MPVYSTGLQQLLEGLKEKKGKEALGSKQILS